MLFMVDLLPNVIQKKVYVMYMIVTKSRVDIHFVKVSSRQ